MKDDGSISGLATGGAARWRRCVSQAALALVLALAANVAQAGIIPGDSVDVAVHAPNLGEVCFLCGGVTSVTVAEGAGDAIEPYLAGSDWFQVDINSTNISISFNRDISWQSGNFIGLVVSDIDWLDGELRAIPGTQLMSSVLSMDEVNSRLQHTDTSISFNWQGLFFPAGTHFDIALAAAPEPARTRQPVGVSEPGTLFLLFGIGVLLLCRNIAFWPSVYFRTE